MKSIFRQLTLIQAYRHGIKLRFITKSTTENGQVIHVIKQGSPDIYNEAALEYRNWEIVGAYLSGALKGVLIAICLTVLLEFAGLETGLRHLVN